MSQMKAQVDKLLTNASKGYIPEGFIGDFIFPPIKVKQDSGKLGGYGKSHLRLVNTVYGGRGKAPRFESITRTSESYQIENHGLEGMVTDEDYRNVEDPFDAEKDETLGLVTILKISREKSIADALGSTSIITQNTTLSGTSQFSDYLNSDPLSKFKVAQETTFDGCGVPPDTAIMSWKVMNTLSYHPAILEGLGFQQNRAGTLTAQEVASAMKVERILVGQPKYNSANLGQTDVLADIWGKNVLFAVLPKAAAKMQVGLGYTIRRAGESPFQTSKWAHNNPRNATGILVTDAYDDLLSDVSAAYLIKDAIA
jgi:hypothetical protein